MIQDDIPITFRGKAMLRIAVGELADELFEEIEGFGDVMQSQTEEHGWRIFARVESASAINSVLIAMERLLSQQGIPASSVSVEVAGKCYVLSELSS